MNIKMDVLLNIFLDYQFINMNNYMNISRGIFLTLIFIGGFIDHLDKHQDGQS